MRNLWLLFALFAIFAVSSATIDVDGIGHFLHRGKRQAASGTGNSAAPTSDDSKPSSAAPSSQPPPRTSNPPASSRAPSSNAPASQAPASSNAQPTQAPSSQAPKQSDAPSSANNANPTSSQSEEVLTTPMVATSVQPFTTVIVTTESNGQQVSFTSTGSSTNVITTGQATVTNKPTTNNGSGDSGKGITENSRKIIGGVVGGVGGAILLGGIALVCWRIWGRKKRVSEDDDDLMAGTGSALGDKPHGSGSSNTPFQSNLEQYHNPGGRPNAAANF